MTCLEVNEFSACEIQPSHWWWSFSWLIDGERREEKEEATRNLMAAIQMWRSKNSPTPLFLFHNFLHPTLDLGLPAWNASQSPEVVLIHPLGNWWSMTPTVWTNGPGQKETALNSGEDGGSWALREVAYFHGTALGTSVSPRRQDLLLWPVDSAQLLPPPVLQSQKHSASITCPLLPFAHLQATWGRPAGSQSREIKVTQSLIWWALTASRITGESLRMQCVFKAAWAHEFPLRPVRQRPHRQEEMSMRMGERGLGSQGTARRWWWGYNFCF